MRLVRTAWVGSVLTGAAALTAGLLATAAPTVAQSTAAPAPGPSPQFVTVPNLSAVETSTRDSNTACELPDGTFVNFYHCYTPQQIRAAYGVDQLTGNYGAGQTIVLVDAYGSPTAASDLQTFHNTFFAGLPSPDFQQIFPLGNPQYNNTANGKGQSGSSGAAGWSGEATLDIEWAYSIAPEAHIVLLAVPPAETEGVQGFPNLFKAISGEIAAAPAGTVFSMSFAVTEQTFGGAAPAQVSKFDSVFQQGLAKDDNFFAASGDDGTDNSSKQARDGRTYPYPTAQWPATSPYVVAVGGTQLQSGWLWDPSSDEAFTSTGYNPGYWQSTAGSKPLNTVWNESWAPIGTGGGVSAIYPRPWWQSAVDTGYGNARLVPDTAWNAAVNGGVDVWISSFPQYNCGNSTGCWTFYGGTSAATPQTAALVALANAARAGDGKAPIGFLDPILYRVLGATSAYNDVNPVHEGTAPASFAGTDLTPSAVTVDKSVGDLVDNQMWEDSDAGYPTTSGYDLTTGWGTPNVPGFVNALAAMP